MDQKFKDLIWAAFSDYDKFEKTEHQFLECRRLMMNLPYFRYFTPEEQFEYCTAVVTIANATAVDAFKAMKPGKKKGTKNSLWKGFKKKETISLDKHIQLK